MQTTTSSESDGGVAGSSGSAKTSRAASRGLRGSPARRRGVSALQRQRPGQYGADRQIAPRAVEFLETRLAGYHKLNITRRRAVFRAAQLLSRCDHKNGARLGQKEFSSYETGKWIQEGLSESGLAYCIDWNSWKPTHWDFKNAKSRAFVPCLEFLWRDTGSEVVSKFGDYCAGRVETRDALHNLSEPLILCESCGVNIPANVSAALGMGTGLRCDYDALRTLLMGLPEKVQNRNLCAALSSVGRVECNQLRPIWEQHEWGRMYASKPALVSMPKVLIASLRNVDGFQLWEVDFSSFELRIAANITGQKLPDGDAYGVIAEHAGLSRQRVKAVINPMLHGQTERQCWYAKDPNSTLGTDRPLVEHAMARIIPTLMDGVGKLRKDHSLLQREGARIFFACMGKGMETCGISSAGLPKHDGWVFGSTEDQAQGVREVFEHEAKRLTGSHFPVKCGRI